MQVLDLENTDFDTDYKNGTSNENVDVVFRQIPKNSSSFFIWKIQNSSLQPIPKEHYGTFNNTDCYIIYAASPAGINGGPELVWREIKQNNVEIHVHFWLGSLTTSEKSGFAAYKTVELDGFLQKKPTQHREVENYESPRFKSYFKNGIKIVKESTTNENNNDFTPKLYKLKTSSIPIVTQMTNISWEYFNSEEVYLLHTKSTLFIWIGRTSNSSDKHNITKIALEIQNNAGNPKICFVDDGYEQTLNEDDKKIFHEHLNLSNRFVRPLLEDTNLGKKPEIKLYKCEDASGKYRVSECKNGPLKQSYLISDNVFILDQGLYGIWVWVGKNVNSKERSEAMRNARGFVKKKKYPSWTPVTRVIEGNECVEFKCLFSLWKTKYDEKISAMCMKNYKMPISKFDAEVMNQRPALASEYQILDDGSGMLQMWRVKNNDLVEIDKKNHGIFYSNACYILAYSYVVNKEERNVLYSWVGKHSNDEEKQIVMKMVTLQSDTQNEMTMKVYIVEGYEPNHFLQLFKGKMIIFNEHSKDSKVTESHKPSNYLLEITGSAVFNTKAKQVLIKSTSLDSNHCFVLHKKSKCFVWCGSYTTGDGREVAKNFASADFNLVLEGNEKSDFWEAIGGKSNYTNVKQNCIDSDPIPPRLFLTFVVNNSYKTEEILNFTQNDLSPGRILLLDAQEIIYVWVGCLCSNEGFQEIYSIAMDFLQTDPAGRNTNTTIIKIKQHCEPPTFTGYFPKWDKKLWETYKSYESLRQNLEKTSNNNNIKYVLKDDCEFDKYHKYPISILKGSKDDLPQNVNPLKKELHLTHDDFVHLFRMNYADFESMPQWKKQNLKKNVGLF